jgi:hypothetical protein
MCAATTELLTITAALRLGGLERESSSKFREISREPSTAITPIPIKQISTTAAAMKVLVRIVRREKNRDAGSLANVRMVLLCPAVSLTRRERYSRYTPTPTK